MINLVLTESLHVFDVSNIVLFGCLAVKVNKFVFTFCHSESCNLLEHHVRFLLLIFKAQKSVYWILEAWLAHAALNITTLLRITLARTLQHIFETVWQVLAKTTTLLVMQLLTSHAGFFILSIHLHLLQFWKMDRLLYSKLFFAELFGLSQLKGIRKLILRDTRVEWIHL